MRIRTLKKKYDANSFGRFAPADPPESVASARSQNKQQCPEFPYTD
jgi:hypothetical protein